MPMQIISTGSYLPELIVSNDDLATFLETSDEWIRTRSGIRMRRDGPINLLERGDLVLLTAFGGGLSSGAVLLEW